MVEDESPHVETRSRSRWLWRAFFVGLGLILLLALVLLVVRIQNRARLERHLREIEQRGEPVVLPAAGPTKAGAQTLEWLGRFEDVDGADGEWALKSQTGVRRFLELPEGFQLDAEDRTRLARLAECLRPGSRWGEDGGDSIESHAFAALYDGLPPGQWDECVADFILTRELAYPRLRAILLEPVPEAPLDAEAGSGLERIPKHLPWLAGASSALLAPVGSLATRRFAPEIVARVGAALRVDALCTRQVSFIALKMRCLLVGRALAAIRMALAELPPDATLDSVAPLLCSIEDERAAFRRALCEERALGNEVYAEYLPSTPRFEPPAPGLFPALLSYDQPYYLSVFEDILACVDHGSMAETQEGLTRVAERLTTQARSWRGRTTPVALLLLPRFTESLRSLREQRAWIELVRLGLRVRALPHEAALAEIASSHDPYSSTAFPARMDEQAGLLAIWSVGSNGRDDGAPTQLELLSAEEGETSARRERDDLVLRVRMR
jgi:hypothetical protein